MTNAFAIPFPATKGRQAGRDFFTATIPYKYITRLFSFNGEEVPADLRAQRKLNDARAIAIGEYITQNLDTYVLPAITASCDQSMTFEQISEIHPVGILHIPMDAKLLINDGQHRRKGIEFALRENPALAEESVSVTIYYDRGLSAAQQVFSDINSNASKPSGSINALYDLRNPFSRWVMGILDQRPLIKARIDMEAASPAKSSSNLWSLVAFHTFISTMTGANAKNIGKQPNLQAVTARVLAFLDGLETIPLWKGMLSGEMSAESMREQYVISHAVFLHALGLLGSHIADASQLAGLAQVDPNKSSKQWQDRCVVQGKMRKTTDGVKSTACVLMDLCGIELPEDMKTLDALCRRNG